VLKVYFVFHFHFDSEYRKPYEEYLKIGLERILEYIDASKRFRDFKFVLDQIVLLEPFVEKFPEKVQELKELCDKNKLEIVCGMYAMSDTNLPSGESLLRQIIYHKKWVREKFGIEPKTLWMIDVFGQNAQMPLICKHTGIDLYIFSRGALRDTKQEFIWEALDGSKVVAIWLPKGYDIPVFLDERILEYLYNTFREISQFSNVDIVFYTCGGDFAEPRIKIYELLEEKGFKYRDMFFKPTLPAQLLKELDTKKLSLYKGEFNPIFQGTYSSRIKILQENRRLENKVVLAEKLSTLVWLLGDNYEELLEEAWKKILFNQFHDIICGCHTDEVYDRTLKRYGECDSILTRIIQHKLRYISGRIRTSRENLGIIVFNSLPWSRTDIIEVEIAPKNGGFIKILDYKGKEAIVQVVEKNIDNNGRIVKLKLLFLAENVPPLGYKTYYAIETDAQQSISNDNIKCSENLVETPYHIVEFPSYGGILSKIYDKNVGVNFIDENLPWANNIVWEKDNGDLYEYEVKCLPMKMYSEVKRYPAKDADNITIFHSRNEVIGTFVKESGPLRATIEAASWSDLRGVRINSRIMVYSFTPRIDFKTKIIPSGRNYRLRVIFPTSIRNGEIWNEIPFGAIKRSEGEYPAQNWIDYTDGEKGIALLNKGIPGNNIVDNTLALSILKSTSFQYKGESRKGFEENSIHEFEYSIITHKGDWRRANIPKLAQEYIRPLIAYKFKPNKNGELPEEFSFLEIKPDNIILTAMYVENERIYLRVNETHGRDCTVTIKVNPKFNLKEAWLVNALGEKKKRITITKDNRIEFKIRGFSIRTLQISTNLER